jgi:peroxiredoxin Q/BCP
VKVKKPATSVSKPSKPRAAPAFALESDTGEVVRLKDLKGKRVVLFFYPKDLTPGCTQEACEFRDSLAALKFKQKHGLNFPLLSDPDGKACEAYGVWQEKSLYGRKFMGIVRTTVVIGADGKLETVFPKVKVAGHVDAVLAFCKT